MLALDPAKNICGREVLPVAEIAGLSKSWVFEVIIGRERLRLTRPLRVVVHLCGVKSIVVLVVFKACLLFSACHSY